MASQLQTNIEEINLKVEDLITYTEGILNHTEVEILPYKKLEYIQSTGTQYINTNYRVDINTKIQFEAMCTAANASTSTWTQVTGARNSYHASSAIQVAFNTQSNVLTIDYGNGGISNAPTLSKNTKFTVQIANNNIKINDISKTQSGSFSGTSSYPLWIFDENDAGNHELYFVGRIYYYKIYSGSTLVRDLIPVKRRSDNLICMYDKVNNIYYTNAGTGTFTAGPVIS